jgi:hypothetical protein
MKGGNLNGIKIKCHPKNLSNECLLESQKTFIMNNQLNNPLQEAPIILTKRPTLLTLELHLE